MGMYIGNVASFYAQRTPILARGAAERLARTHRGARTSNSADRAAGLAISERLRARVKIASQTGRNAGMRVRDARTAEETATRAYASILRDPGTAVQAQANQIPAGSVAMLT